MKKKKSDEKDKESINQKLKKEKKKRKERKKKGVFLCFWEKRNDARMMSLRFHVNFGVTE